MSDWCSDWRPRAVVFDLDGLMFNTEELYQDVGGEMLRRRGKLFEPELLDAMMGRPARVSLQIMIDWHSLDDTVEELAVETEQIFAGILADRLECMPGLLRLARVAGTKRHSQGHRHQQRAATLWPTCWPSSISAPRFQFVLTSEDIVDGKPHPEIYLTAARRFGVPPHDLLVLEDSYNGCQAAIRAGTFAVAVPAGHSRRHDFSGAALEIDTLSDPRLYAVLKIERIAES